MELSDRQKKLLGFVVIQHGEQKRKYTGEPYWLHVLSVADIVSQYEPDGIEVALCHDLFEDTRCKRIDLYNELIANCDYSSTETEIICDGVMQLTDIYTKESFPKLNRKDRKEMEAIRLGQNSPLYQSVKYADLIDNTSSIVKHDPNFAKIFLKEKVNILRYMRNGNIDLFIECCYVLKNALIAIHGK